MFPKQKRYKLIIYCWLWILIFVPTVQGTEPGTTIFSFLGTFRTFISVSVVSISLYLRFSGSYWCSTLLLTLWMKGLWIVDCYFLLSEPSSALRSDVTETARAAALSDTPT